MNYMLLHIPLLLIDFLDTTSVLMVGVTAIAFIFTWCINRISILRIRKRVNESKEIYDIMQHTLDANENYVLRLDLRQRHAYNLHGSLLPKEGMGYEESFNLIHPEDHQLYRDFLISLSRGNAKTAECIFRWDMSGDKHAGEWRYMHDQGVAEYVGGQKTPINIFCTLTDQTERIMQERESQELTDKYRKTFEQSLVGLAFYDKDGHLLTVNQKMREILKFQSEDDPYYFENTLYDMPTFRDVLSNRYVEELFFCSKSVIIERGVNCYTEMRVHPIHDEGGELVYITFSIRDVTQERELYMRSKQNGLEIRRANEEIQNLENEIQYLMDSCDMRFWRTTFADRTVTFYKGLKTSMPPMNFDELREHFVQSTFKDDLLDPENRLQKAKTELALCHPFFHEGEELQWNIIDSVPYYDKNGKQLGTYGIMRNVTPLIKKQEQLKQETERAQNSGRMKSVFMANMTHEIRTPLNAIVGFSDVLSMLETPEEKQEIVRVIMNNCDMLLRLINDILAVSAIDGGSSIHIHAAETDFATDFENICKSLAQRIQNPNVTFIKENPYTTLITTLDKERVQQVITNFVTNAVKYTHEGHIKVGYEKRDGGLYFYCEDTGTGIPKEDQGKIFERFVKLNDYVQGTGLGLNISKAIVETCHGQIGVNSEGEGHGSTFWFWIPCEIKVET
jgi:signal transduction histidine kinase/PAS domain-containing protein